MNKKTNMYIILSLLLAATNVIVAMDMNDEFKNQLKDELERDLLREKNKTIIPSDSNNTNSQIPSQYRSLNHSYSESDSEEEKSQSIEKKEINNLIFTNALPYNTIQQVQQQQLPPSLQYQSLNASDYEQQSIEKKENIKLTFTDSQPLKDAYKFYECSGISQQENESYKIFYTDKSNNSSLKNTKSNPNSIDNVIATNEDLLRRYIFVYATDTQPAFVIDLKPETDTSPKNKPTSWSQIFTRHNVNTAIGTIALIAIIIGLAYKYDKLPDVFLNLLNKIFHTATLVKH